MNRRATQAGQLSRASLCVTADHDPEQGVVQPIYTSTSYYYIEEGPQPYPRYFNTPNQDAVARKIAELENAEDGLVFGSGMAAISTCVMSLVSPGDHVLLLRGLYGGTHSFLVTELKKWGVDFDFASTDIEDFRSKLRDNTVLAFVESPTNPCLDILDLQAMSALGREAGVVTAIDNTFASPINQNPIDLGFDLVLHSGTKYLGGHSDLSCGAVVGRADVIARVRALALKYGGTLNPIVCHLLERSIKTLDVRVKRQNENALAVADFLESHAAVARVLYPGLTSHAGHELAAEQMRGFGGMMSFELLSSSVVRRFLESLTLVTPAMSLGGVESIMSVPVFTSHKDMSEQERLECGVRPNLIRFSVGIEDKDDLIADLGQALDVVLSGTP